MQIIDKEIIRKHLRELDTSLTYLKGKKVNEKDLIKNIEERFAVERALHLAIQNVIDIGNHILASLNINDVETYADIPMKLAEAGIISEKLASNLAGMARLRNVLVHEYVKVGTKRLVSFLKNNLGDFSDFARAVAKFAR